MAETKSNRASVDPSMQGSFQVPDSMPAVSLIEGFLKKQNKLMSSKNFYKVVGNKMYMAPSQKK